MRKSLGALLNLMPLLPLTCLAIVFAACQNKPNPVPPTVTVDAGITLGGEGGAPPAASATDAGPGGPSQPVFFTADAGGPGPTPPPSASNTPPGPPALGDAALDAAIDIAIGAMATKNAPNMQKEGQPGRQTLREGEHFAMVVTLQPGRCYTFLGFSPPGAIAQLDMHLYMMPLNVDSGHSAPTDKAAPVMGKGSSPICPISPIPVPYRLDVAASKGAGRMGVYVYSRNK